MSTIKLNELAESDLSLTDLIAKADANGLMTKTNVQKLSNLIGSVSTSGMKGAIESTSAAPTEDGLYPCTESGTYTNFGGIVVDVLGQIVFISVSDSQTVFKEVVIPLDNSFGIDSTPTDGSTNAVSSGGVYYEFNKTDVFYLANGDLLTEAENFKYAPLLDFKVDFSSNPAHQNYQYAIFYLGRNDTQYNSIFWISRRATSGDSWQNVTVFSGGSEFSVDNKQLVIDYTWDDVVLSFLFDTTKMSTQNTIFTRSHFINNLDFTNSDYVLNQRFEAVKNDSNLAQITLPLIVLDFSLYPNSAILSDGSFITNASYQSAKFDIANNAEKLFTQDLTFFAFFDENDNILQYINHNVGSNAPRFQDSIPNNTSYCIASNFKSHTNIYVGYSEEQTTEEKFIKNLDNGETLDFGSEEDLNENGQKIDENLKICCAGSSVTWGLGTSGGFLQSSFVAEFIKLLQNNKTNLRGVNDVDIVGNSNVLSSVNDKLNFNGEVLKLTGIDSSLSFDLFGDEISFIQNIERSNYNASIIEVYIDNVLYDSFSNYNNAPLGSESKQFTAVSGQMEFLLEKPFTYNHVVTLNGVSKTVKLIKSYTETIPTGTFAVARDVQEINGDIIVQHTLFSADALQSGDVVNITYNYGQELTYEKTTIGKDNNGDLENSYGRGYTVYDPANPTSSSFASGLDFREVDKRVVKQYKFKSIKKRLVEIKIKELDSRANVGGTPYFNFNFATSRMLYFMNAGIGGFKSSNFNNITTTSYLKNWKQLSEFRPDVIFYESTPNDDWVTGGYKAFTVTNGLSLTDLQSIRTMPNKNIEFNNSSSDYTYERFCGYIDEIDRYSVKLSASTQLTTDPVLGDSIVLGTYFSDSKQQIARLVRSYDSVNKIVFFDHPLSDDEIVYNSIQDLVGKEVQIRDLEIYKVQTEELLGKLKDYTDTKIVLVPNGAPNMLSRDLKSYQPYLNSLSKTDERFDYTSLDFVIDWQNSQKRDQSTTVLATNLVDDIDGFKSLELTSFLQGNNYMNFQVLIDGVDVTNKDAVVHSSYGYGVNRSLSGVSLDDTSTRGKQVSGNFYPKLIFLQNAPVTGSIEIKCTSNLWSSDSCHMNANGSEIYGKEYYKILNKY